MRLLQTLSPLALAAALVVPLPASAETYEEAYARIVMQMHMDMGSESTGNAEVDFAAGMIPHHEGAVAMAELLLEHGTDPELRAMAEAIIATQTAEIAFLQGWLEKNAPQN